MNSEFEGMQPGSDVAFLVGAGRSGTTLLYKLLALHPDVAYIGNYENRLPWLPPGIASRFVAKNIDIKLAAWFAREGNAYFISRPWIKRLCPTPHEGESVYAACGVPLFPAADFQLPESTISCMRDKFSRLRKNAGAQIVISKRTANNRRIEKIDTIFPAARYVHLIRDGREVAQSLSLVEWWDQHPLWWDGRTPPELEKAGERRLSICARNWALEINQLKQGLAEVDAGRIAELRFEELLAEPVENLRRVTAFLGLSFPDSYREAIESLNMKYRPGKWQESWSSEELASVMHEAAPLLRELNYLAD